MPTMPEQKPGLSRQDYGTPIVFLDAVKALLGVREFDLDVAATGENRKAVQYLAPPGYVAPADVLRPIGWDGLKHPWGGHRQIGWNWCNPPFGKIGPWVCKAAIELRVAHAYTAVLVPAAVGANWWRDWVHGKCQVLLLNGRLTFEGEVGPYPKDCALLLYGRSRAYWVWDWKKGSGGLS